MMLKFSRVTVPTLREKPVDCEVVGHELMLRAGLMRPVSSGIYMMLPLGLSALLKVENIVREEMNKTGAIELELPSLHPSESWQASGRWFEYGPEMMRLTDRHGRDFCLGPTAEELITHYVGKAAPSYRDLPVNLYQIKTKFRDEPRPRFGLLRAREFRMKDAYSFHRGTEELDETYERMYQAYLEIARRCSLEVKVVEASTGLIGGDVSHEFMVLSDAGEDTVSLCEKCGYGANAELERHRPTLRFGGEEEEEIEEVHTPGLTSIDDVSEFMGVPARMVLKCVLYVVGGDALAVFIPGYREVSTKKLAAVLKTDSFHPMREDEFPFFPSLTPGFVGPVGLRDTKVIFDEEVVGARNIICGANKEDYHLKGVEEKRDFRAEPAMNVASSVEGDECPSCDGALTISRGIEIGHIFKLGLKYSKPLGVEFTDRDGSLMPVVMGTYGMGTTRILQTVVEQHHDDRGIRWPKAVAPIPVELIVLNSENNEQIETAENLSRELEKKEIEVLIDDRSLSPGIKFNDADLVGLPIQVVIGNKISRGMLDLKLRYTSIKRDVEIRNAGGAVENALKEAR
ncbi:MAG: proline--tRNA ligase [Actinomycetota bacterium]|nr:proline--tRNA ligase [Actinomycetota bacterium]